MLPLQLVLTALLAATAFARPSAHVTTDNAGQIGRPLRPDQKLEGEVTVITGIEDGRQENGAVPIRRELRDMQQNFPDIWNLYLLGLHFLQQVDQNDPLSFYQIAGIHGRPFVAWQNAQGLPGVYKGYCPHTNILFFGWHRAYLALFEQELYKHVQNVASQFPYEYSSQYGSAAEQFRMPYWDAYLGQNDSVPDVLLQEFVEVIWMDGNARTIDNPLHHYRFLASTKKDFTPSFSKYNTTVRWPDSTLSTAQSQNDKVRVDFTRLARLMHENLATGFGANSGFNEVSLHHFEPVHGNIHHVIGGSKPEVPGDGHMWPLEYSGFDPVFMLHHCNFDRLYALYLDAHPDEFLEPHNITTFGTFAIEQNSIVDTDTPLSPFWKTQTTFWTSNELRDSTVLGYAYPETQWWNFASKELYRTSVNATIAELYSTEARTRLAKTDGTVMGGPMSYLNKDDSFTDWSAEIAGVRDGLPMSFSVRFSIVGAFYSDPVTDAGTWQALMPQGEEGNVNSPSSGVKVQGSVSLTAVLLDEVAAGKLENLEPAMVVPYLAERLTWMVYSRDGTLIPNTKLSGLQITVASSKVRIPEDPSVPLDYSGPRTWHPEVTAGKGGGARL